MGTRHGRHGCGRCSLLADARVGLAIVFIVAAWAACVVITRLVQRANWVMGKLKRKVDETVARFWLLEQVKKRFDREGLDR